MPRHLLALPVFAALACSGRPAPESSASNDPPGKLADADARPPSGPTPRDAADRSDPCGAAALGLADARALEPWSPPSGCSPRGDGRAILRGDDELTPRLECSAGQNHLVDFTRQALLVVGYTLSPAGAGVVAFDDGKVITLVSRQRSPCPDDPRPMPMNATAWYLLPAGGERSFADATCTLAPQCR